LFIGVAVQPSIIADNEPRNISKEIQEYDDYEEVITFIEGYGELNWIKRRGYFRGEVNMICNKQSGFINLSGYRRSESGIQYYNEFIEKGLVYAYRFIGYYNGYWFGWFDPRILGIAIGNIEWVEYA
jgi:hypothetical protein